MNKKKLIIAIVAFVAVLAIALGAYFATRPATQSGGKAFTVTVIHKDGTEKEFSYTSNEEYLGPVLLSEGLVEGKMEQYGLYIEAVDGERAVWELDNAYWSVYVGEEPAITGADQIPLTDGGEYKLVYIVA